MLSVPADEKPDVEHETQTNCGCVCNGFTKVNTTEYTLNIPRDTKYEAAVGH
jgi:hypothetical protein